jgi:hypothetical protein
MEPVGQQDRGSAGRLRASLQHRVGEIFGEQVLVWFDDARDTAP